MLNINFRINGLRAKFHGQKKWSKILEALLFTFGTACCFYWAPYIWSSCLKNKQSDVPLVVFKDKTKTVFDRSADYDISRAWCEEGTYNPLATLLWKTEAGVIRQFMDANVNASRV